MNRRDMLLLAALSCGGAAAPAQQMPITPGSPVDSVALYVLPTDGISEQAAGSIARALTRDTGLWVKSTTWVPSGDIAPFAGTHQYPGEDYLALAAPIARRLQDTNVRTYFIVLTDRDINARVQNHRFQFSMHSPMARTSVLSAARLLYLADGSPAPAELVATRLQKMLMRIVGEMRLGWTRSTDPVDLMYAPIMSLDDIDRMSLQHTLQTRQAPR